MANEIKIGDTVRLRDDTEREGYTLLDEPYEDNENARVVCLAGGFAVVNRQLDGALFWCAKQLEKVDG